MLVQNFFTELTSTQIIIIGVTIFVFGTIISLVFRYYWNRVEGTSEILRQLTALNNNHVFHKGIKKIERINKECNSKAQFDKTDLSNHLMGVMESGIEYFDALISKIEYNRKLYKKYEVEYYALKSSVTKVDSKKCKMPLFVYKLIEREQYHNKKVKPQLDTEILVRATYVSLKGKNSYHKNQIYDLNNAKKYLDLVHLKVIKKDTKQFQRSIMSDSLRFEILQRDQFKCKLCGSSAQDGAKLHVDHIIPIAKGGKTIKTNLRALCDRCNLGKSDKIE